MRFACGILALLLAGLSAAPALAARPSIGTMLRSRLMPVRAVHTAALKPSANPGSSLIGSLNTLTADPAVPRPRTKPCVVPLFTNFQFAAYAAQGFSYTPPAACPPPWSKVVFEGDFAISPGVQYDRTLDVWLGNTNLLFGTTPEPLANIVDTWHVERDVTDLTALLRSAQPGEVELFNIIEPGLNGVQSGSTDLAFYPSNRDNPAPKTPDVVLPMSGGYGGELLSTTATQNATVTFTSLPANIERAYLDVYAQSQSGDEFWYLCLSSDVTPDFSTCGNTAFRETDISIDGQLAGVAPVHPWIYTGGIDPYLWTPIPGGQTLDFTPYRVDLTPFAALLSNGKPHQIAIGVFDANSYFSTTGTLELFLDRGRRQVTGGLLADTLTAPSPVLTENVTNPGSAPNGKETVASSRDFTISGYTNTSQGRIETQIRQHIDFNNSQQLTDTANLEVQNVTQSTHVSTATTTSGRYGATHALMNVSYPLTVDISLPFNADGSFSQATSISQLDSELAFDPFASSFPEVSQFNNLVTSADTLEISSAYTLVGNTGQASAQTYRAVGPPYGCYGKAIAAAANAVTAVNDVGCFGH